MSSDTIPLDYDEIDANSDAEDDNDIEDDNNSEDDNDNDAEDDNNEEDYDYPESDDNEDLEEDMDYLISNEPNVSGESQRQKNLKNVHSIVDEYLNDSDDDEYDETYLQKFDANVTQNYIDTNHPEVFSHNFDEVTKMMQIHRDNNGNIIDPCHKTLPIMTKFEKTRIIGQRAKQIETGSIPFIKVPDNIIDSYLIAELELQQRKLPFIIRRPLPNGTCEYWDVNDLEMIHY